jgi:uncharacterized YigZ family protein
MDDKDDPDIYYSLPQSEPVEIKIKRSRFIARSFPVKDEEQVKTHLTDLTRQEYKANHHCWAARFITGEERFSDDGEPGGSAGQPILQQLQGVGLVNSLIVVTRYFGGIKLGTGGLARAYSEVAGLLLQGTTPVKNILTNDIILQCAWMHQQTVFHFLEKYDARVVETTSTDDIRLNLRVRRSRMTALQEQLVTALRGQVTFTESGAAG